MSTRLNISGGSQGEAKRDFSVGFFHDGVRTIGLNKKTSYQFRILPAFDANRFRETDAEYATSYLPYRDKNLNPDSTNTEGFTPWYYVFRVHHFLGRLNKSFVSPLTGHHGSPVGIDPVLDCYMLCKKTDSLKHLIEKPKNKTDGFNAVVTTPRNMPFFNVLVLQEKQWVNAVMYCTISAMDDLKGKLALRAGRNDAVISPEWPDYIYGDVTHPTQGLLATSRVSKVGTNAIETSCIFFSSRDGVLDGSQTAPVDPSTPFGQQTLSGRYNLLDPEKVIKVATYDEILEYIVKDGTIPYEVICAACQPHCARIPAPPTAARVAAAGAPPADDEIPMDHNVPTFARPAAPAAPAFVQPAAVAPSFPNTQAPALPVKTAVVAPAAPAFTQPAAVASFPGASAPAFNQPAAPTFTQPAAPTSFPGAVVAAPGPLPTFGQQTAVAEPTRVSSAFQASGGSLSPAEQAEYGSLAQEMIANNGNALPDDKMRRMAELGLRVNAAS